MDRCDRLHVCASSNREMCSIRQNNRINLFFCHAGWVFVPFSTCTCDRLLSRSLSPGHHPSSAGVKVKDLLTWPPRITDCGVKRRDRVRMHVTLWLRVAASVGAEWKHLQFKGPAGSLALQGRLHFLLIFEWGRRTVVSFYWETLRQRANAICFVGIRRLWMTVHIVFLQVTRMGFWVSTLYFLLSASQCRCKCANTFCARLPSSAKEHNSGKRESSTVAAVNSAERNERKKTNRITVSPLVTLALLHVFWSPWNVTQFPVQYVPLGKKKKNSCSVDTSRVKLQEADRASQEVRQDNGNVLTFQNKTPYADSGSTEQQIDEYK